jgi:chromosome segregation ATPase
MDSETVKLILEFIEKYGFPAAVAIAMFVLFWRQQGLAKMEAGQQDKMLEQNANTLSLYTSTKETIKSLDATLAKWFKTAHDDSAHNNDTIQALTVEIGSLRTSMDTHNQATPKLEDILQEIKLLSQRVDNAMEKFNLEVTGVKTGLTDLETRVSKIKRATQEVPVLDKEVKPNVTSSRPDPTISDTDVPAF